MKEKIKGWFKNKKKKKENFSVGWVIFWVLVCWPLAIIYLAVKLHKYE